MEFSSLQLLSAHHTLVLWTPDGFAPAELRGLKEMKAVWFHVHLRDRPQGFTPGAVNVFLSALPWNRGTLSFPESRQCKCLSDLGRVQTAGESDSSQSQSTPCGHVHFQWILWWRFGSRAVKTH